MTRRDLLGSLVPLVIDLRALRLPVLQLSGLVPAPSARSAEGIADRVPARRVHATVTLIFETPDDGFEEFLFGMIARRVRVEVTNGQLLQDNQPIGRLADFRLLSLKAGEIVEDE